MIGFTGKMMELIGQSILKRIANPEQISIKPIDSSKVNFKKIFDKKKKQAEEQLKILATDNGIADQLETIKFQVFVKNNAVQSHLQRAINIPYKPIDLSKDLTKMDKINITRTYISFFSTRAVSNIKNFIDYTYLSIRKCVREYLKAAGEITASTTFYIVKKSISMFLSPNSLESIKEHIAKTLTKSQTVKIGLYLYPILHSGTVVWYWYSNYQNQIINENGNIALFLNALSYMPFVNFIGNYPFFSFANRLFFTLVPVADLIVTAGIISGVSDCLLSIYSNDIKGHSLTIEFTYNFFINKDECKNNLKEIIDLSSYFAKNTKNLYFKNYKTLTEINENLKKVENNIGQIFYSSIKQKKYMVQDINKEIYLGLGDTFFTIFDKCCNILNNDRSTKHFSSFKYLLTYFRSMMVTTQATLAKALFYFTKEITLTALDICKIALYATCKISYYIYSNTIDLICDGFDYIAINYTAPFFDSMDQYMQEGYQRAMEEERAQAEGRN